MAWGVERARIRVLSVSRCSTESTTRDAKGRGIGSIPAARELGGTEYNQTFGLMSSSLAANLRNGHLEALRRSGWKGATTVPTICKWVNGTWTWPEDAIPYLSEVLGMSEYSTAEAVRAAGSYWDHVATSRRHKKRRTSSISKTFDEILAQIDADRRRAASRPSETMKQTVSLFAAMTNQHYFFATTFTEMPLIFQAPENQEFINAHYRAILNGGMFCIVVPNEDLSAKAITAYALDGAHNYSQYK